MKTKNNRGLLALLKLPYGRGQTIPLRIPKKNLIGIIEPRNVSVHNPEPIIEKALDNPVASSRLEDSVRPGQRITILVDDNTRPTPVAVLLPAVLKRLLKAGANHDKITILIAGGTHRLMTRDEIRAKIGRRIFEHYRVVCHEWMRPERLVTVGLTASGTAVEVNRLVAEADFCIGLGDIAPHPLAGWSGGCKIVEPGACGPKTTSAVHARISDFPELSFLGCYPNPIRHEIELIGRKAGLKFIVNTILNGRHKIVNVVAGDPVLAHRAGIAQARLIWTCPIEGPADIVIASSYPADLDFWQAQKTLHFMEKAVKRGGSLILLTPCPEGLSPEASHCKMIRRYAALESKRVMPRALAAGEWDLAAVTVAKSIAATREIADITIVSEGLLAADCRAMRVAHGRNLQAAFEKCRRQQGKKATVLAMPFGPKVIPVYNDATAPAIGAK